MSGDRRETPSLKVGPKGAVSNGAEPVTFRTGFAQLLDLAAPPIATRPLAIGEATRIGVERVGAALNRALAQARERFGG